MKNAFVTAALLAAATLASASSFAADSATYGMQYHEGAEFPVIGNVQSNTTREAVSAEAVANRTNGHQLAWTSGGVNIVAQAIGSKSNVSREEVRAAALQSRPAGFQLQYTEGGRDVVAEAINGASQTGRALAQQAPVSATAGF